MKTLLRKIRLAFTPHGWLIKTTLDNGAVVYGKNRSGFGGRGIYVYREEIEPEFAHFEKFLDKDGLFIDVGANTGIYTLKAAQHFRDGGGSVIAIEPFPDILATLHRSIQINDFTNVRLRNFCAGKKTEAGQLWMNYDRPHSFSLVRRDDAARPMSTLVIALDDLFEWEGVDRLDYIKIDAEGSEEQVLQGGKKIIATYRPIIQMEVNINDVQLDLPEYLVFRPKGSPNKLYIPSEHPRASLPNDLGWKQIYE